MFCRWNILQCINFRIHNIKAERFYTVDNAILNNKEMSTYIELFMHLNDFIFENRENKRNKEHFCPITVHCDFEIGLIGLLNKYGQSVN